MCIVKQQFPFQKVLKPILVKNESIALLCNEK